MAGAEPPSLGRSFRACGTTRRWRRSFPACGTTRRWRRSFPACGTRRPTLAAELPGLRDNAICDRSFPACGTRRPTLAAELPGLRDNATCDRWRRRLPPAEWAGTSSRTTRRDRSRPGVATQVTLARAVGLRGDLTRWDCAGDLTRRRHRADPPVAWHLRLDAVAAWRRPAGGMTWSGGRTGSVPARAPGRTEPEMVCGRERPAGPRPR
jgi:hypothetical protein